MIEQKLVPVLLYNRVPLRIVSKARLIHKLVIERRVYTAIASRRAGWGTSFLSFEKLSQNQFLLILHPMHVDASSLNRSAAGELTMDFLTKSCSCGFCSRANANRRWLCPAVSSGLCSDYIHEGLVNRNSY